MTNKKRVRVDVLLVERGLCDSRSKAQALIMAGQVLVGDQRIDKPGTLADVDAELRLKQQLRYVSRGGLKLEGALGALGIDVAGAVCADVGASTGGFTDCLLQRGARKVYAIDVGSGLLAAKLASDERVIVMDRTNARFLTSQSFPEPIDMAVVDASFIGIAQLAQALADVLRPGARLIYMIKPQFEVGREHARRSKGVITDPALRDAAIANATTVAEDVGFRILGSCDSPLAGPKGNLEHFVFAERC